MSSDSATAPSSGILVSGEQPSGMKYVLKKPYFRYRVKSGNFGHQVNSEQTVKIQMKWLLMSRLIRIFTVCLVIFFIFIQEMKI